MICEREALQTDADTDEVVMDHEELDDGGQ